MDKNKRPINQKGKAYSIFSDKKDADSAKAKLSVQYRQFSLTSVAVDSIGDPLQSNASKQKAPETEDWVEFRSKIRKTLREFEPSNAELKPEQIGDQNNDNFPTKQSCVQRLKKSLDSKIKKFNEISHTNLKIRVGAEVGSWDRWGVYYCSNRFGRHTKFNHYYFALASIIILGQGSMLNLIYYMGLHGGCAFLVVLILVYISVGYCMYLFETSIGQYSGRKPLEMIRYMLPALSGIGPALYLRTFVKAVNALATFVYCAHLSFGLFFCKPTAELLIYRFVEAEERNKEFTFNVNKVDDDEGDAVEFKWWWLTAFTIILFVLVSLRLKTHGIINVIMCRVYIISMIGYLFVGMSRAYDEGVDQNSLTFAPLKSTVTPEWDKLFSGQAWLDAMIFVIQAMELGTLVHPYLGSKCFFHYRCDRDGMLLVLLSIGWNFSAAFAALAWLGYVGIDKEQMITSSQHLFGHYGLFVVFMVKHLQAEMTQNVQGDLLFFNAIFYSIIGVTALSALVVYLIILIDCSYSESGHLLMKFAILFVTVLFFGYVASGLLLEPEGLRCLIFINFYVHKSWSAFFIVGCYFGAVVFGHDMGKFMHDFLNIMHLSGYESRKHAYFVPRIIQYFVLGFLGLGMICYCFARPYPHEGQTDWTGNVMYIGTVFSCIPLLTIVSILAYSRTKSAATLKPHRDWYKNKHHTAVCFADFAKFQGIPALQDPADAKRKKMRRKTKLPVDSENESISTAQTKNK